MPLILIDDKDVVRVACLPCMKGHRVAKCEHYDRVLVQCNMPGRPKGPRDGTCHCSAKGINCSCNTRTAYIIPGHFVSIETSKEVLARLPNANIPDGAEIITNAKVEGQTQNYIRSNKRASDRGPIRRAQRVPMQSSRSPSAASTPPRAVVSGKTPMLRPVASTVPPMQYRSSEEAASSVSKSNSSEEEIEELVRQRLASLLMLKPKTNVAKCCSHSSVASEGSNDHDSAVAAVIPQAESDRLGQELLAEADDLSEESVRQRLASLIMLKARTNVAKCCSHSSVVSEASNDYDLTAITSHDASSHPLAQSLSAMTEHLTDEDGQPSAIPDQDVSQSSDVPATSTTSRSQSSPLPQQPLRQSTASISPAHSRQQYSDVVSPTDIHMLHGEESHPPVNDLSQTPGSGTTSSHDHYHDNQGCGQGARSGLYAMTITESVEPLPADGCACAGNAECACLGCRDHPQNPVTMDHVMEALAFQATDEFNAYMQDVQDESDELDLDDLLEDDAYAPSQPNSHGTCCTKSTQNTQPVDIEMIGSQDQAGIASTSALEERTQYQANAADVQQRTIPESTSPAGTTAGNTYSTQAKASRTGSKAKVTPNEQVTRPAGTAPAIKTRTLHKPGQPQAFHEAVGFLDFRQEPNLGQQPNLAQSSFAQPGYAQPSFAQQSNFGQIQQPNFTNFGQQPNFGQANFAQPSFGQHGQQPNFGQQMTSNPQPNYSQVMDPVAQMASQQQIITGQTAWFGHMMVPLQSLYPAQPAHQQVDPGHNAAFGQSMYPAQPYPAQYTQQQMNPGQIAGFGQSNYSTQPMYPQQPVHSAQATQPTYSTQPMNQAQQTQYSPSPPVYTGIGLYRDPSQSSDDFLARAADQGVNSYPAPFQPNPEVFHPSGRQPGAGSG